MIDKSLFIKYIQDSQWECSDVIIEELEKFPDENLSVIFGRLGGFSQGWISINLGFGNPKWIHGKGHQIPSWELIEKRIKDRLFIDHLQQEDAAE